MYPSHYIVTHKYITSLIVFKILCTMLLTNSQIKIFRHKTVALIILLSTERSPQSTEIQVPIAALNSNTVLYCINTTKQL